MILLLSQLSELAQFLKGKLLNCLSGCNCQLRFQKKTLAYSVCDDTDGKVCNNNMRGFDVGDRIQKRNGLSTPHHFVKIDFSKVWVIDMVRARRRPGY